MLSVLLRTFKKITSSVYNPEKNTQAKWHHDYATDLTWSRLSVKLAESSYVAENREVLRNLLAWQL